MAPKKAKEGLNDAPVMSEEQQTASLLSQRLQAAAKSQGVRSDSLTVSDRARWCPTELYVFKINEDLLNVDCAGFVLDEESCYRGAAYTQA